MKGELEEDLLKEPWSNQPPQNLEIVIPDSKDDAMIAFEDILPDNETIQIFTDGSKSEEGVGGGWFFEIDEQKYHEQIKLPEYCSIFQAEAMAIQQSISTITQHIPRMGINCKKIHIFSDSWSVLTAMNNYSLSQNYDIRTLGETIRASKFNICLQWIPGHKDIDGNEEADKIAKKAAKNEEIKVMKMYQSMNMVKTELFAKCWNNWKD